MTDPSPGPEQGRHLPVGWMVPVMIGAGFLAGFLAKLADKWDPMSADLASHLGLWVVLIAVIARLSPTRTSAAIWCAAFFVAMTIAYYGTAAFLFGNTAKVFATFWLVASLTATPLVAAVVQGTKMPGWRGALAIALPAGLLVAEALRLLVRVGLAEWVQIAFDLVAASAIVAVWARGATARLQVVALLAGTTASGFALARGVGLGFRLLKP